MFDHLNSATEDGKEAVKKYTEATFNYLKLKIFQQVSFSVSLIVKLIIIGGLLALGIIFIAIALTIILGNYFGNMAYGCLAVAGLFFLFCLIAYLSRKTIDSKILKIISSRFFI